MSFFNLKKTWRPLQFQGGQIWIRELLFALCALVVSTNVYSNTIQVTNTNTSGAGSFHQAVQDYIAGGTSSTISFDAALIGSTISITQAYSLSANTLTVDGDINNDGVSDITLRSDGTNHRFFSLSGTAGLTLYHLQVENFSNTSDGGMFHMNGGSITMGNCRIKNNSGRSGGVFYITKGNTTIKKSIFSGNSATSQGGVFYQLGFGGSINTTVESSLFFNNSAPNSNGGVAHQDFGATLTLRHVTCVSNTSRFSGGAISNSATLNVENSLFVANDAQSGADNIQGSGNNSGSIFGGENGASNNLQDYFINAASGDYKLIATSPAVNKGLNALTTAASITTDILGNATPYDGINDIVDAGAYEFLGDPPISFTSSSVINSSTMTITLTFDRHVTGLDNSDFSTQASKLSLTSLTTSDNKVYTATFTLGNQTQKAIDTVFMNAAVSDLFSNSLQARDTFAYVFYVPIARVTHTQTSGEGSLDQALKDFINAQGVVNSIQFDPSLSGNTIMVKSVYSFTQGTLLIDGDINNDGTIDITLKSDGLNHGFFKVNGSASLTLEKVRFTDFLTTSQWGALVQVNSGTASLSVKGCEVKNIRAPYGGAIYCQNGNVSIKQTIFDGNSANSWGGAISIYSGGTTTIENTLFFGNSASVGGAIYGRNGANIKVRHCTFFGNTATSQGGAIYNLRILTAENSLFIDNKIGSTVSHITNGATFNNNGGNIMGGEAGASNTAADYFTDASNNDYTLHRRSLAADKGVNALATNAGITTDLLGNTRPYSGTVQIVDAGAYELQADPDFVAPTVSIATTSTNPTNNNPVPITITFNESVTGFIASDVTVTGGTISNFAGWGANYSFNLVPSADGALTVNVGANVATDVAGNGNTAASQLNTVYDGTVPTVNLATTSNSPTKDNPIPVTVTFSESVTGFTSADLTVAGGAIDNFAGSGANYSFNLVPSADGTLTVDVAAAVATDAASNGNSAATQLSVVYDGTAPTVSIGSTSTSPTRNNPIPITITFSESVTGFQSSDISANGGSVTNFNGTGANYSFDLVPGADGALTVDVVANVANDAAGNSNTAATQLSMAYDGTAPTVSLATTSTSPTKNNPIPVTITFSESVTGFTSTDITTNAGTITNFTGTDANYSFDLVPGADGTLTVDVGADVAADAAGNGNVAATQLSVNYDGTAPTVSLATTSSNPTKDNPIPVTITFSETVTGFTSTDLTINGGSITNFSGTGASYSFDLVPNANGAVTVDVAGNVAVDAANNGNTAATQLSVTYDNTAPTVSLATTSSSPTNVNPIPVTVTFSEVVTGFASTDVTVNGGQVTNFIGTGASYSFELIPGGDGAITVDVAASVASDAANNSSTAATQLSIAYDGTAPSVSLASTASSPTRNNLIPVTVIFSETVTGFTSADLTINGGNITNFAGSGSSYSFDLVPSSDGNLTIDIAANAAMDATGNGNTVANQLSLVYDSTVPTVSLATTSASPTRDNPIPVTITFSESVTNFVSTDITVSGGQVNNFAGTGANYTFDLIPGADGTMTVDVGANVATDGAGNSNTAATQLSTTYDGTAPTVTIGTTSTSPTKDDPIPVSITFSEPVTGFISTDVVVNGGTMDNFTGSGASYSFNLVPGSDGTLTVDVVASVAADAAGNGNTVANQLSVTYDSTAPTVSLASTSTSPTNNNPIPVSITFSESVTGFVSTDIIVNGGSMTNFAGTGASYSFDLTPSGDGTLTVDIEANVAVDRVSHGNTAATLLSIVYDGTAPTVAVSTTSASPTRDNSIPVSIPFSESVTGFESTDITVTGGSVTNFAGTGTNYSFALVPSADGNITIDIAGNVAMDEAGNGNTAATQKSIIYDGTAPTVAVATTSISPTKDNPIPVTVTFSESVTGFTSSDLTVAGGTIDNFAGSGANYSFNLVPGAEGTLTVDVAAAVAADAANNGNSAATQLSIEYDGTAPTVSIGTTSTSPTKNNPIPITITFSESITGFQSTDVNANGGNVTNFTGIGANYSFDLVPTADGTISIDVAANVATDAAGNGNSAAARLSIVYDSTVPGVSLSAASSGPTNLKAIPVTVTFSEAVIGFASSDVTVSGGSVSNFAGSGASYSLDLVPSSDGLLTVLIAADVATDVAGNGNRATATPLSLTYDGTMPRVDITSTSTSPTKDNPIPITVAFSESVTGFESTDVTVNGGTITNFAGSGTSYSFDLIPNSNGTVTVDVGADVATDMAGNGNSAGQQWNGRYDAIAPAVSLATSSDNPTGANRIPVTVTFSESVTGFESSDVTVSGGSVANFTGTGDSYSFDLVPNADGTLTVDVAPNVATDVAGNGNTVATQLSVVYDGMAPTVTLASTIAGPTKNNPIPVSITFSESVTGFESADVTVTGGAIANFMGSGANYSMDLVPGSDGTIVVEVAANVAVDMVNHGNTAAAPLSIDYDATAPTVDVSTASTATNSSPIPVTVTFSELVVGFEPNDLAVVGGSIDNFNGSGGTYTFDLLPSQDGTLTIDIDATVATDEAGNGNMESAQLSIVYDGTAPTITVDALNTEDRSPKITGTIDDPDATISVMVDGQTTNATNHGNGTWTVEDNVLPEMEMGTYDVVATATDALQNVGTDDTINELTINTVLSLEEPEIEFSIYPNPTTDKLSILTNFDHREIRSIQIFDTTGAPVNVPYSQGHLDVSALAIGQYYLKVQIGETVFVKRFLKHQ